MREALSPQISARIVKHVQSYPGVLAGIARLAPLLSSPSYRACSSVGWKTPSNDAATWPDTAKSVLVLAMRHPRRQPDLDWWDGKNTKGNRVLISIARSLKKWFAETLGATSRPLPYHIENGGVFLKDAAVLAGMGVIGKNNLLITPELGPRVRLRGILLDLPLVPTGPIEWFHPCDSCHRPCHRACPQQAFAGGTYARGPCMRQMEQDRANPDAPEATGGMGLQQPVVKYCRACEIACPVGSWEE